MDPLQVAANSNLPERGQAFEFGQLREGVSRKIDDTIYVVSYQPQSYWYGWQAPGAVAPKEQAWVYSFNVADAKNPALVQSLKIFEGGSVKDTP